MTDHEINAAIAEWCGWVRRPDLDWVTERIHEAWEHEGKLYDVIPNYYADLNAVQEATSKIPAKKFSDALMRVIQDQTCCGAVEARYATANATAPQRCEALLRTIWKWKE